MLQTCRDSLHELKSTHALALCAMCMALHVILNFLSIPVGGILRLSFTYLALAVIAYLFGPVTAGIAGGACDILEVLVYNQMGTPFFPGYTLTAILTGVIMGFFFYRMEGSKGKLIARIIACRVVVNLVLNIGLNTLWISMTMGKAYLALLPPRLWKNLIALPLEVGLIFLLFQLIAVIRKRK